MKGLEKLQKARVSEPVLGRHVSRQAMHGCYKGAQFSSTGLMQTKSSTNFEKAGVSEMGLICLVTIVAGFFLSSGDTSAYFQEEGSFCSA